MTRHNASEFIDMPPTNSCTRCGGNDFEDCVANTTMWNGSSPYLVEDIPAIRCLGCSETFIENATAKKLKRIFSRLPERQASLRTIEIPVISFPEAAS